MLRFGSCTVDVAARSLVRDGHEQHLEPQAFDVLAYLISHRDRVVPKAELLDEIWGDQFVSESALTTRIKEVRQAVGDDGARQGVVKNYRGRGYRFVVDVDAAAATGAATGETAASPASPVVVTSLLGRDDDIRSIVDLLDTAGLITLVGPGGVGKTSLAREIGRAARDRHADGVKVVRLARIRDDHGVVHAFRRDTGLLDAGDGDGLIASIAELDALVVVDNCEHVLDEATRIIAEIVNAAGNVRLLATSRERLGISTEQLWPVAPLGDEPARRLLLERARAVQPGYSWASEDEASIDRILGTVDRLPLAIEMAAARLPSIGAADLADVLADRLDLLRSTDRTADDRHRTISALIAWSEDLLEADERELLATLSVFAGPVPVVDIAAVVDADAAGLSVGPLAALVDKSLVVAEAVEQPTRYRLLDTVRASASKRRTADVDARHAHHVADVVSQSDISLRTADELASARRLDGLVAEIRLAHLWARRHEPLLAAELTAGLLHYAHERQWTEPAAWAQELVDRYPSDQDVPLAAHAALAADASNRGDYERAARHATPAQDSDDPRVAASAHDTLANVGMYTGDVDATLRHGSSLIAIGERTGDSSIRIAGALGVILAHLYGERHDDAGEALGLLETGAALSPTSAAWAAYAHAEVLAATEREPEAIERFDRAVELGTSVGSRFVVSVAQVSTLAALTRTGDTEAAMAAFVPVLAHYRRTRSLTHGITALRNLIGLLVRAGDDEPAMVLLGALSNPDVKSTYGIESERLVSARETVVERVGAGPVEAWLAEGAARTPAWAIDYAIDVLDRG